MPSCVLFYVSYDVPLVLCFLTKHDCRTTKPWRRPDSKRSPWEQAGSMIKQGITAPTRNRYDILPLCIFDDPLRTILSDGSRRLCIYPPRDG